MNSLRDIVDSSPHLRVIETQAMHRAQGHDAAKPLAPARWDWQQARKILLVRLRSIGDTVLATPSAFALKRFLPQRRGRHSRGRLGRAIAQQSSAYR